MALHDLKILILCGKSRSSRIVYHSLKAEVKILKVIQEDKISSLKLIRGRSRRIGPIKTTGQVLFIAFNRFTSKLSKAKITALMDRLGLSDQEIPQAVIERVPDINSQRTIDLIKELKPDVVVVNGTRIIKK